MKWSKVGVTLSEIGRARELIGIIAKYGFNEWVSKNGLGKYLVTKKRLARIGKYSTWERVRMAIDDMGPTFIKFGQILADRPDIVPEALQEELRKLQDEAEPMPDELALKEIEQELGRPVNLIFKKFEKKHLASASIAQTYLATLLNGDEVCVKIQRPGIEKKIELDLSLMEFFASRIQRNNPEMEAINIVGVVSEFGRTILKELDFRNEAANVIRFYHDVEDDPDIYVPKVYMEYTSKRIIVEEMIHGIKINDIAKLIEAGNDPVILSKKAVKAVFDQVFHYGFFHADPHPGNIFVMEGNILSFIDFGMMGTLRAEHLQFLGKYALGYINRDAEQMTEALLLMSGKIHFRRFKDLEFQISEMLSHYKYLTIDEMDFGGVLNQSVEILINYGLRIPSNIYLLIKSLATIERVAVTLNPSIDFASEMQPYAMDLMAQQYNPTYFAKEVFDSIKQYYKLIRELPSDINEIIYKIKEGRFKTMIEVKGFEPLVEQLEHVTNRVSIAIVLASLIIGASIISQWEGLRWVGTVIFILAGFFGFWLLIKLFRKGKF